MSVTQWGFYFDQQRCVGCHTCAVACKEWHGIAPGPVSWRRVESYEEGRFPDVSLAHLSVSCHHCRKPACVTACPSGAMSKRVEDGIVVVDRAVCLPNCQMCLAACPYGAPQFSPDDGLMQKCDLCLDRLTEDKPPICVASCPLRALDCGPIEELERKHDATRTVAHFPDPSATEPSIVFRARQVRPSVPGQTAVRTVVNRMG